MEPLGTIGSRGLPPNRGKVSLSLSSKTVTLKNFDENPQALPQALQPERDYGRTATPAFNVHACRRPLTILGANRKSMTPNVASLPAPTGSPRPLRLCPIEFMG